MFMSHISTSQSPHIGFWRARRKPLLICRLALGELRSLETPAGFLHPTRLLRDQISRGKESRQLMRKQAQWGPIQAPLRKQLRPGWLRAQGSASPHIAVLTGHGNILLGDVNVHVIQGGLLCHMVGTDKVKPIRGLAGQAGPSEDNPDKPPSQPPRRPPDSTRWALRK